MKKILRVLGIYAQGAYVPTGVNKEWLEPLGLEYILGQAAHMGHAVNFLTMYDISESGLIQKAVELRPDVIAMSAMTCQIVRALRVAKAIKRRLSSVKIVIGGYQPSAIKDMPELMENSAIDYWVVGEGEVTFREILEAIEAGKDPIVEHIPGLAQILDGAIRYTPRKRERNLDQFGRAWRPIELVKQLKNRGLVYPAPSDQCGCVTLEHSRGCKGTCLFCCSVGVLGCSVSFRSADAVCAEIDYYYRQHGINEFFFADLDFIQQGEVNQARVGELCHKLIALDIPIYWEAMGRIQSILGTGNFEILRLMYEAGCRKIGWGVESLDPEMAKSMHKGHKGTTDTGAYDVLHVAEDVGILNTGFLVIGWHDFEMGVGDSRESIEADLKALIEYPLHRIRVAIGTPLPGSKFYRSCKERGLLTDSNLEHYDTNHLVYAHPLLNPEELDELRERMYKTFYGSEQFQERMSKMLEQHPEYRKLFDEFLGGLRQERRA